MLGDLGISQRQIGRDAGAAEVGDEAQRISAPSIVGHDHIDIAGGGVALEPDFQLNRGVGGLLDKIADNVVAHREAGGGHVGGSFGDRGNQSVVTATTRHGAHGFLRIEDLEDDAGIIGQPADDREIQLDEIGEAAGGEFIADGKKGERGVHRIGDEFTDGFESQRVGGEPLDQHFRFLALDLVDDAEKIRDVLRRDSVGFGEVDPSKPVRHAHHEITRDKAERQHRFDRKGDQLGIGGRPGLAEDIDVELMELAAPALLRLFVAETLADLEPLERLRVIPLMLRHDPRQRGGHLRPQRHVAAALVLEAEQLRGKLATGFFQIEPGVLQDRGFVFHVAAATGDAAPGFEQVITDRALSRSEVAESWKCLE